MWNSIINTVHQVAEPEERKKYIRIGLRFVLWLLQMLKGILKMWVLGGGYHIYIYI